MSSLRYFNYSPFAGVLSDQSHYSQAVRIADRIECSGQGGWDPETGAIPPSLAAEIEQAFANVDACLRSAGGKGWSQVYRINLYTTELSEELFAAWAAAMKKWAGEQHRPLLTGVAVAGLALPGMRVEIEVVAHAPESAEA
ncbi:endoribonuclease L-psp family protein [Chaetomium strumarium]|uniref:Endoribonuclease L-psp family protein n=1 Tax=Chaetomium strumarium TaxID=1170767 RepID=A0AAJ0GRH9_9PEZI|nr:endoribonuclease L-psp family protein [Chaetomium strumarium]